MRKASPSAGALPVGRLDVIIKALTIALQLLFRVVTDGHAHPLLPLLPILSILDVELRKTAKAIMDNSAQ